MDGQRMDQIARSLASGVTRREALQAVAIALGLSAAGTRRALTAPTGWCLCAYACDPDNPEDLTVKCGQRCRLTIHVEGTVCGIAVQGACNFSSKEVCEEFVPEPPAGV
jgi:hypothetical protein